MLGKALQKVFSRPPYAVLAVVIAISVFSFAVWLPNWRLIFTVITSPSVSFIEAVNVILSLFLSIGTNFTTRIWKR